MPTLLCEVTGRVCFAFKLLNPLLLNLEHFMLSQYDLHKSHTLLGGNHCIEKAFPLMWFQ